MRSLLICVLLASLDRAALGDSPSLNGSVQVYDDDKCTQARGDPIPLQTNSCLEANQSAAIAALSFPSCETGQATLFISDQIQCGKPTIWPLESAVNVNDCLSFSTGSYIGSAAFECVANVTTVSPNVTTPAATSATQGVSPISPTPAQTSNSGSGLSVADIITIAIAVVGIFLAIGGVWYARQNIVLPQMMRWSNGLGDAPPPYAERGLEIYRHKP